jgi:hypothetical protein
MFEKFERKDDIDVFVAFKRLSDINENYHKEKKKQITL